MIENKFTRVAADDPTRCQGITNTIQCPYKAKENSKYCPLHGGNNGSDVINEKLVRNYRLNKYRAQLLDKLESPQIIGLREEVGICRIILEEILNKCDNGNDIIIYHNKLCATLTLVQNLVTQCRVVEEKTGKVLDDTQVMQLCDGILNIITKYIDNPDIISSISTDIIDTINNLKDDKLNNGKTN